MVVETTKSCNLSLLWVIPLV